MTDTNRVKRWRDAKRDRGLKAVTIWLTPEEELRLKDMALQWHCSPSVVMQQALAQVSAQAPPRINTETDMSQIRELIRAEFLAMQGEKATVTETVTEVVTETLARDLPVLVRQLVEGLALEALGLPVTDTYSDETDAEALGLLATDTDYGNATDIKMSDEEVVAPEPRTGGRPRGEMRQRILTLLGEHPEGLSAEQIRAYIQPGKPLGDTLQGMRKQQKVTTRGTGKDLRYFVVS
jgi:predicted transcriptional regulator